MPRSRILVVEDEENLQTFYRDTLAQAGYHTRGARAGQEALRAFGSFSPDLVLLDLGLDGELDGFEVLSALRYQSDVRIVILTGQGGDAKLVRGLNLGADNYLLKPVSKKELVARVQAQLRRRPNGVLAEASGVYRFGELMIDLDQGQAILGRQRLTFGGVEARILFRLLRTPDQPVTHRELLEIGWGFTVPVLTRSDTRALLSCIYRIRDKFERLSCERCQIRTVPNIGFSIASPDAAPGVYRYGTMTIDVVQGFAVHRKKLVTFGEVEHRILARLLQTPGQPVTHEELKGAGQSALSSEVKPWDTRRLHNSLYRLREKLERLSRRRLIENVPNIGFSIALPDEMPQVSKEQAIDG